jgi:quinol-cytochrome oxidoreductase complex cytochrome b subunit
MPDQDKQLGATRGVWWWATALAIVALVGAAITIFILVRNGQLSRPWAYAALPIALLAAAASRVLTLFKAVAEDKRA